VDQSPELLSVISGSGLSSGFGLRRCDDLLEILLPGIAILDRNPAHPIQVAALGCVVRTRQRLLEGARQVGDRPSHLAVQLALAQLVAAAWPKVSGMPQKS